MISLTKILFGGDDGGAGRDPGDGRGSRSHDLCHRVRVQSDLIFFWLGAVDQLHGVLILAMAVLNGDGVDGNRFLKLVELVSAKKESEKPNC